MERWQTLQETIIYDAMPWVRLSSEHVRLPSGVEIEDFYRVDINPYVMMFAITDDQEVIFVEHYKHGPQAVSVELPAGYVDAQESPLDAAQRELREETGYESRQWTDLGRQFIDGNRGCGWVYSFLAQKCRQTGQLSHEPTELMTLHHKTLAETYQMWMANTVHNVASQAIIGRSFIEIGYLKANA